MQTVSTQIFQTPQTPQTPQTSQTSPKPQTVVSDLQKETAVTTEELKKVNQDIEIQKIQTAINSITSTFNSFQESSQTNNTRNEIADIIDELTKLNRNNTPKDAGAEAKREQESSIQTLQNKFRDIKRNFEKQQKTAKTQIKELRELLQRLPKLNLPKKDENNFRTQINELITKYQKAETEATQNLQTVSDNEEEVKKLIRDAKANLPKVEKEATDKAKIENLINQVDKKLTEIKNRKEELEKIKKIRILTEKEQTELVSLEPLIEINEAIKQYLEIQKKILDNTTKLTRKEEEQLKEAERMLNINQNNSNDELNDTLGKIKDSLDDQNPQIKKYEERINAIAKLNFQKDNLTFDKELLELIGDTRGVGNIDKRLAVLDQRLKVQNDIRLKPEMTKLLDNRITELDEETKEEIKRQTSSNISDAAIQMFEASGMPTFQLNAIKRERAIQEARRKAEKEEKANMFRQDFLIQSAEDKYSDEILAITNTSDSPDQKEKAIQQATMSKANAIQAARDESTLESTRIKQEETAAIEAANIAHKDFIATLRSDIIATAKDSLGGELSTFLMQDLVIGVDAVTGQTKDLSNELKGLERVLYNVTKAILNSIIQLTTKNLVDGIVNSLANLLPGAPKVTTKALGGVVKNYAGGGLISSVNAAFIKERSMNGGIQPVLAALTPGERVLTVEQNKRFEQLQLDKVLNYANGGMISSIDNRVLNYANGGMVSTAEKQYHQTMNYVNGSYVAPSMNTQQNTVNNQKPENTFNIPITIQSNNGKDESNIDPNQLRNAVQSAVLTEIQRQQRQGGILPRR